MVRRPFGETAAPYLPQNVVAKGIFWALSWETSGRRALEPSPLTIRSAVMSKRPRLSYVLKELLHRGGKDTHHQLQ